MSGSPAPEDHSVQLAQIESQQARDAQAAQDAKDKQQREKFTSDVGSAYTGALDSARQYFTSRGLNPDDYMADITAADNSARTGVPDLASNPGTYFSGVGATAATNARDAKRGIFQRNINSFAPSGFETRAIGDTSDDATLAAILAEQRSHADEYVRNLLDRGVINSGGFGAAEKDLDTQSYGAKSRLQELGNQELNKGRTNVLNKANEARNGAANFELGDNFDPFQYSTDISGALSDFFQNMGGNIRGLTPSDLFSTSGLANIAGAAQGAQNLKFNPAALAGVNDNNQDDEEDQRQLLSAF